MSCNLLVLAITLINLSVVREAVYINDAYRKFMYQKDMSQYCRRNVLPSVFLGRQVIGAYSQVLRFSRLEVPYNCFINVRTEMGSKIIVFIQVTNDVDLDESCNEGASQLFIHEMGETFGGYWGPIPDSMMKPRKERNHNTYTLRPTTTLPPSTIERTTPSEETTSLESENVKENPANNEQKQQYLTIELPIVNVSAEFIPKRLSQYNIYSTQDKSNLRFGTAIWRVGSQDTKVGHRVDVHTSSQVEESNTNLYEVNYNPELQLEFNNWFTPDPRLTLPTTSTRNFRRKLYKFQPKVNKILDFRKNKKYFVPKEITLYTTFPITQYRSQLSITSTNVYLSKLYETTQPTTAVVENQEEIQVDSWEAVHNVLKELSDNIDTQTEAPHFEIAKILHRIANAENNQSAYLAPNVFPSEISPRLSFIEHTQESSTKTLSSKDTSYKESSTQDHLNKSYFDDINIMFNKSNALDVNNSAEYNNNTIAQLLPLPVDVDNIILSAVNKISNNKDKEEKQPNLTFNAISTTSTKKQISIRPVSVSLVDHESWENVVKVAPVMAIKLNKTHATTAEKKREKNVKKATKSKIRKKRYMHAVDIAIAQPHQIHLRRHTSTTQAPVVFDMREFQRLIEMQDDEIHGRVSLRDLRPYIGPPLLNICALNMTTNRHVYLFNSSRIVLAISNFTLKRMTVVLTPARTLRDIDARCPPYSLECQISGARVCIDSLTACDGVPNCGAYDIYDEDRLQCGGSYRLHHNVCLAAITVLALVLTLLYTIHYWLRRCIPKVSDAFFVYTDAVENVLYLETVMRSPQDIGYSKYFYHHGEDQELDDIDVEIKENLCKRFMDRCVLFFRCRRKKVSKDMDAIEKIDELSKRSKKLSSFAKTEIDKMTLDVPFLSSTSETGVQTENSFQMVNISPTYSKEEKKSVDDIVQTSRDASEVIKHDSNLSQASDELFMLKFLKGGRPRSISIQLTPLDDVLTSQLSTAELCDSSKDGQHYNPNDYKTDEQINVPEPKFIKVLDKEFNDKPIVSKQLRFYEEATVIRNTSEEEIEETNLTVTNDNRRNLGVNKLANPNEDEEPSTSAGRELKSYFNWGNTKDKKKKKIKKK